MSEYKTKVTQISEYHLTKQIENYYNNKNINIKRIEIIKKENMQYLLIVLYQDNKINLTIERVKNWIWKNVLHK